MSVLDLLARRSARYPGADVRPTDPPRVGASGPLPHRLLVIGGEAIAGHGVTTHELSLLGHLARAMSGVTALGTDVEGVVLPTQSVAELEREARERRFDRYDGVVVLLEPERRLLATPELVAGLRRVLAVIRSEVSHDGGLLVGVVEAAQGTRAAAEAEQLAQSVERAAEGLAATIVLHAAETVGQTPVQTASAMADRIAARLAPQLPCARVHEPEEIDEHLRARASASAIVAATRSEWLLNRIVDFAASGYSTRSAAISIIDTTTTFYAAGRRHAAVAEDRGQSICNAVLCRHGGLIVDDARLDPRFRHLDGVRAGKAAFYAGVRLMSPDGQPIGALCVYDQEPRPVAQQDLALLRDYARRAERQLWLAWPDDAAHGRLVAVGQRHHRDHS